VRSRSGRRDPGQQRAGNPVGKAVSLIGHFRRVDDVGRSSYNALQVSVRRHSTRVLPFSPTTRLPRVSMTAAPFSTSPLRGRQRQFSADPALRAQDRAVSNIDAKHTLNMAFIYTTPGPRWIRGWHLSAVFIGHKGCQ